MGSEVTVGDKDGFVDGLELIDGLELGCALGSAEGFCVGETEGLAEGLCVGDGEGLYDGLSVGFNVIIVGDAVGRPVCRGVGWNVGGKEGRGGKVG